MARVLVVDDEPDIRLMLQLNLEAEGHEVLTAADGAEALAVLDTEPVDVVILDVMMPVLDGFSVLERLQGYPYRPPVVVVSAKTAAADVDLARRLGAADYITKPFDPDDLLRRVDSLCR